MIKNYLKIAIRNIIKHKGFSAINIVGLAIGIACSVLIWIFVAHDAVDALQPKKIRSNH